MCKGGQVHWGGVSSCHRMEYVLRGSTSPRSGTVVGRAEGGTVAGELWRRRRGGRWISTVDHPVRGEGGSRGA